MRRLSRWIGRRAALFALLVAALLVHRLIGSEVQSFGQLRATVAALGPEVATLRAYADAAVARSDTGLAEAQRLSTEALDARIAAANAAARDAAGACGGDVAALLRGGAAQVVANRQRCVQGTLYAREAAVLTGLRDTADARRPGESLGEAVRRQTGAMNAAAATNIRARAEIAAWQGRALGRWRYRTEIAALVVRANTAKADYDAAKARTIRLIAAQQAAHAARVEAREAIVAARAALDRLLADARGRLGGNVVERARGWAAWMGLDRVLRAALIAFIGILLTPYAIRVVFYTILAPLAARRPPIRLRVAASAAIPIPERSTTSVGIVLADGEELLVRQDYLQSSGHGGSKRTRWLLDWRHPISSVAAHLVFLTRIRGGGPTTVSAVRDPLAEVTMLSLPEGAACVLQPRALAAVVQPQARPLRITRHWRLLSLNAWLTLQLRYIVFHGPGRLVVKGSRGVRVEPAAGGRVFGQDQLIGFSAGLSYSVTRTETFWPYLFGRESLLKDHLHGGDGVLLVEEAPLAARPPGEVRHGLEGAMDALLKVFGI